jgi:hypothetical protein
MAIDFSDPAQTTHNNKPIPIGTQAQYDAGLTAMQALYGLAGVAWTATAADAYEKRVRNGQTAREIVGYSVDEFLTRTDAPTAQPN